MSATVATLGKVRQVYLQLLDQGESGAVDKVVALCGGSKSTVAKHLRVVRAEVAAASQAHDPTLGHLQGVADTMVQKLWAAAQQQAAQKYDRQIRNLLRVQQDLSEDLEAIALAESETASRAVAAEERLQSLERETGLGAEVEAQIRSLVAMVRGISSEGGLDEEDEQGDEVLPNSPILAVLEILERKGTGMTKDDVDRLATEAGYSAASVHKARWRCVKHGYVRLVAEPVLHLTDKGTKKVGLKRAAATRQP
jgi:hypothetical protein